MYNEIILILITLCITCTIIAMSFMKLYCNTVESPLCYGECVMLVQVHESVTKII